MNNGTRAITGSYEAMAALASSWNQKAAPGQRERSIARKLSGCRVVNSSGCHRYGYWNEQNLFDGNRETGWCTPSRKVPRLEFLEIDLGTTAAVTTVRVLSRAINGDTGISGTVRILTKAGALWSLSGTLETAQDEVDHWHEWDIDPAPGPLIRLEFDDIKYRPEGKYFLQFMCLEFYVR